VDLLIATANAGKAREFRQMLGDDRFAWHDLTDQAAGEAVEETGRTFRDNACLKASHYARRHGVWALADDSGLAVDALGGAPGVYSARWAKMNRAGEGDAANNAFLLNQLRDVPTERRGARFVCVLALADPRGRIMLTAQDFIEGTMLFEGRGAGGFGYDPLFHVPSLGLTTAEMTPAQKHAISHRGKALVRLRGLMDRLAW
jgi:XTP/dITP diphosphohydrolase